MQRTQFECPLSARPRSPDIEADRCSRVEKLLHIRVDYPSPIFPADSTTMVALPHRRICGTTQQLTSALLEHERRPIRREDRCFRTTLLGEDIHVSTMEMDSASA